MKLTTQSSALGTNYSLPVLPRLLEVRLVARLFTAGRLKEVTDDHPVANPCNVTWAHISHKAKLWSQKKVTRRATVVVGHHKLSEATLFLLQSALRNTPPMHAYRC
jgi:hypothetical protein